MTRARAFVAPAYLLACLLLGGSEQGILSNMLLQMVGVIIIAWAAASGPGDTISGEGRALLWIAVAGLGAVLLQLIPLPASVWPHLGGRAAIAEGYSVLGIPVPALPISLAPYESIATLVKVIPALAILCSMIVLKAYRPLYLALALLFGAFAGILLGAVQVANGGANGWYLYPESSFGYAAGFFANANHMALLLVIAIPFLAAMLAAVKRTNVQQYSGALTLAGGALIVLIVGIVLSRSGAGYGLTGPVVLLSILVLRPMQRTASRWLAVGGVGLIVVAAAAIFALSPLGERHLQTNSSVASRSEILATTSHAVLDFLPLGSGLGTFQPVYNLYEDHDRVTNDVINHAHNDYVELVLELGAPALLLIVIFLLWWGRAGLCAWRLPVASAYARAGSIASAAILAHSLVDFPARTAAIGACLAMSLALLLDREPPPKSEREERRPVRHMVLE